MTSPARRVPVYRFATVHSGPDARRLEILSPPGGVPGSVHRASERPMSKRQHQHSRRPAQAQRADQQPPHSTSKLELTIPNKRSYQSLITFVDCVLVELTHEVVGAEYVVPHPWGTGYMQYIAIDTFGERFRKRRYCPTAGWSSREISRSDVRLELIQRFSREQSIASTDKRAPDTVADSFSVKPISDLSD